jgi:hypothetical protein
MTDDDRAARISMNEAVFRELNEQIERLAPESARELKLVCECGDPDCHRRLRMSVSGYEALRSDPRLFAVVPGHQLPDVETVVESGSDYVIVRKHDGTPASIARRTDPRHGS